MIIIKISFIANVYKPGDYSVGAMENWGLITYRETALLVDPENSSARIKQWVALVVGHELAHQWFGNLVTMVNPVDISTLKSDLLTNWQVSVRIEVLTPKLYTGT